MSKLVLVRHSPTAHNESGRLQGRLDIPLSDAGRILAAQVADRVVERHGIPDQVMASPLSRAVDSAEPIAERAEVGIATDQRLQQRSYGEWEGLTWDEVRERYPREYERRMDGADPRIAGWETWADVADRMGAALREAGERADLTVVVSHGSSITAGLCALLRVDPSAGVFGHLPHGAWHVVARAGNGQWRLRSYGLGADWP